MIIAQFSDSHLFADKSMLHHDANVYQNLLAVLISIKNNPAIELAIFTGDLTQDHTEQSYQCFVDAVKASKVSIPIYYLPGNHDEIFLMDKHLTGNYFCSDKLITSDYWQIHLMNSKSETPAGELSLNSLITAEQLSDDKFTLLMMHHHAIKLGYFIDRHSLQNSDAFWQLVNKKHNVKAVACGHVHRAFEKRLAINKREIQFFSCPATSIEFDINATTVSSTGQSAGYRIFYLQNDGEISSEVIYVPLVACNINFTPDKKTLNK